MKTQTFAFDHSHINGNLCFAPPPLSSFNIAAAKKDIFKIKILLFRSQMKNVFFRIWERIPQFSLLKQQKLHRMHSSR